MENLGEEIEHCLDPDLWSVFAGGVGKTLEENTRVCYFPQGHKEYAFGEVDFRSSFGSIPSYIVCRVLGVKYLANRETDEVYAKIRLVPVPDHDDVRTVDINVVDEINNNPISYMKILTASDANGCTFTVPSRCADSIFPQLDKSIVLANQTLSIKDCQGKIWMITHIYRGSPKRHLLTTGWVHFVNSKKLVCGDSIIFVRTRNGELHVGIRRKPRGTGGPGTEVTPTLTLTLALIPTVLPSKPASSSSSSSSSWNVKKVRPESVMECLSRAMRGQAFEVVYYPRPNAPEFCVKESKVRKALQMFWRPGHRFKMAFENEQHSLMNRVWLMGTVSSVEPNSLWRSIRVTWEKHDPMKDKNVSPWMIELVVPEIPQIDLSLPRRKRQKRHQQIQPPPSSPIFSGGLQQGGGGDAPFYNVFQNKFPVGIQGARQNPYASQLISKYLHNKILNPPPATFVGFDYNPMRLSNADQVVNGGGGDEVISDKKEKDQRMSNESQVVSGEGGDVVIGGGAGGDVVIGGGGGEVVSERMKEDSTHFFLFGARIEKNQAGN